MRVRITSSRTAFDQQNLFHFCSLRSRSSPEPRAALSSRWSVLPNTTLLAQQCFLSMMARDMELRHLRYFVAVCEALNFTKAAAQLCIAQPALSRQVQDLEDEIGVDLLKRSPRGVTITAEGKLFLEEAREVLKHADESVEKENPDSSYALMTFQPSPRSPDAR
jgi:Bacterial regulatory helix-turn-helix protein, lysR family